MRSILAILVLGSAIQVSVGGIFSKTIKIDVDEIMKELQSGHIDLQSSYKAMNRELAKKELKPDEMIDDIKTFASLKGVRDSHTTEYEMSWTAKLLLALERAFSDGCTPENDRVLRTCMNSVKIPGSGKPVDLYIAYHASRYANLCLPNYVRMINAIPDINQTTVNRLTKFMAEVAQAEKLLPEKYDDGQFVDRILEIDWLGMEKNRDVGEATAKTLSELEPAEAETAFSSNDNSKISALLNKTLINGCSDILRKTNELYNRVLLVAQVHPRLYELVNELPANMKGALKVAAISKGCYALGMSDQLSDSLTAYLRTKN